MSVRTIGSGGGSNGNYNFNERYKNLGDIHIPTDQEIDDISKKMVRYFVPIDATDMSCRL
ncbi:MAG: hypothetical protein EU531_11440 [Promethearchaeota archaeon]|nr:MAG: hypothetical protein EU531_11440 [Candidatus Lokiarchaeota archaeon]